ncbi:glutamate ABC transporter substrate-binding protein [Antrihabitans cavernicola]|uniref:Glutamate ABC transporter substrate-binding protein n=1 Tax=Antrihabitans cavernicola TaxID=2495913 RepID=A0A5A7SAC8_9NOCA|nr:glutamate ABC transporter substrate-binding protein [Spelaeibacter cavernicola]KAA0022876.1 glutamate ABC transporter substrate-binding protein [Spelaeibacter cavernicola]
MSIRTRRHAKVAVALLASVLVVSACSSGGDRSAPTDNGASGDAKITIGISDDEPGLADKDGSSYKGFDIDTANFVAGKLGVPTQNIVWKPVDQGERISALTSGDVDLVVSTFSITADREKQVSFSKPYYVAHQDLLIRRNDDTITSPETLDGKVLCAASGTTSADYVKANYRGKITLREVPSWSECVRNLANGDVDAVSTDDLILAGFAALPEYKGVLRLIGKGFTDENYGIGVKKGDTERVDKVNAALADYVSSGAWKKSLDTWFVPSGYKIPDPPSFG